MKKLLVLLACTIGFVACGSDTPTQPPSNESKPGGDYTPFVSMCSKDQSGIRVYLTNWNNNIFVVADPGCP